MAAEGAAPLDCAETDRYFAPLNDARGLALAVSGGADSVALMHLAAEWRSRRRSDLEMVVLTIDHGLRPESAEEARTVRAWAAGLGLAHETLVWTGDKPATGLQEAARTARYRLMAERCSALGLTHLASGHHLDDQAETVLFRLARGSGLDGLAGMAPALRLSGPILVRPLLDVPKARLVASLRQRGQDWLEDVSNRDERFARTRLRRLLPALAAEGLTADRLAQAARRFGRARVALDAAASELRGGCLSEDPAGFCRIDLARFAAAPEEVSLRLLGRVLMAVAGAGEPPRLSRLERLQGLLLETGPQGAFAGATLAGCRISIAAGEVIVCREWGRANLSPVELTPEHPVLWDGRFHVRLAGRPGNSAVLRPLGADGLAALRRGSHLRPVPAAAARTSAAVFVGGQLFAAPHLEAEPGPFSPEGVEIGFIGGARLAAAGG